MDPLLHLFLELVLAFLGLGLLVTYLWKVLFLSIEYLLLLDICKLPDLTVSVTGCVCHSLFCVHKMKGILQIKRSVACHGICCNCCNCWYIQILGYCRQPIIKWISYSSLISWVIISFLIFAKWNMFVKSEPLSEILSGNMSQNMRGALSLQFVLAEKRKTSDITLEYNHSCLFRSSKFLWNK